MRKAGYLVVVCAALVALGAVLASGAGFKVRVASVNSRGVKGNDNSSTEGVQQLSNDGRLFVFASQANNLPGGDGGGNPYQAYVHDFKTGKTKLVSHKPNGDPVDGGADLPSISANGRFVTWSGVGTGLPNAGAVSEVWISDLKTGKTRMVSVANNGDPATGSAYQAVPNADGSQVAFTSVADNLPRGDGIVAVVYVRDLKRHRTRLVSSTSGGKPAEGNLYGQSISANGRLVAFSSYDPRLAKAEPTHIYVKDMKTGKTRLVDKFHGEPGTDDARNAGLAPNGRWVTFASLAPNLPGGNGSDLRCYVFDLKKGRLSLAGKNASGDAVHCSNPRLSGDGKLFAFESLDATLPGNDGVHYQVYSRRLPSGKPRLLSRDQNGDAGEDDSFYPSLSRDGRFADFEGYATNLGGSGTFTQAFRAGLLP